MSLPNLDAYEGTQQNGTWADTDGYEGDTALELMYVNSGSDDGYLVFEQPTEFDCDDEDGEEDE